MAPRTRTGARSCVSEPVVKQAPLEPSVFGFTIRSSIALRFLRHGGGSEPLEIVEDAESDAATPGDLLGEWPLHGTAYPAHATLVRVAGGYQYLTSDAGLFRIDMDQRRIHVPATGDELLREQRLHGLPMVLAFIARGDISLHAAAVEVGQGAVILAAPSRHGKSTLAMAFQNAGHRVLSEDLVCCRPATGEAIPGPALLRIRPDMHSERLPDGLFVAGRREDRVFVGFDPVRAGSAAPVPITAIVFLREALSLALEPADPVTALKDLWHLNFRTGTEHSRATAFQSLSLLAGSVQIWNATRPLVKDALPETVEMIRGAVDEQ